MVKRVIILGASGMLGNAVFKHFIQKTDYDVIATIRSIKDQEDLKKLINFDLFKSDNRVLKFETFTVSENQWIVECFLDECCKDIKRDENNICILNCIGLIKPYCDNIINAIKINSLFPHLLANACEKLNLRCINIATDCVWTGKSGQYLETDSHDANDVYGKSKSLGESNKVMNIRCSIIGEEIKNKLSLLEWVKSQNLCVNGYVNHIWNGVTTKHYAELVHQIIEDNLYEDGIFHVYSKSNLYPEINKKYLVSLINEKYNLNLKVNEHTTLEKCDRSLRTCKNLMKKLKIKTIEDQIKEL